jgi:hypothetical protein
VYTESPNNYFFCLDLGSGLRLNVYLGWSQTDFSFMRRVIFLKIRYTQIFSENLGSIGQVLIGSGRKKSP